MAKVSRNNSKKRETSNIKNHKFKKVKLKSDESEHKISLLKKFKKFEKVTEENDFKKNEVEKNEESDNSFNIDSYPSDSDLELHSKQTNSKKKKSKMYSKKEVGPSSDNDDDRSDASSFNMDSYPSDDESEEENKKRGKPIHSFPSEELEELERRTIFIGNLPINIERRYLKKFFSRFGPVESVRLRCAAVSDPLVPKKVAIIKKSFHSERNSISAYIRFKNIESSENALQSNGAVINKHTILVDNAVPKKVYDSKKSVFVGNVPFGAEEEGLRSMFSDCGDIESVRIIRDKNTGVGKGFAFINFKCSSSVPLALKLEGQVYQKRELRVHPSCYRKKKKTLHNPKAVQHKRPYVKSKNYFIKYKKDENSKTKKSFKFQGETGQRRTKKMSKKKFIQDQKRKVISSILANKKKVAQK